MAKAGKTYFSPIPLRALRDARLSGTHIRGLGGVASHDWMSLPRGKGAGCYASTKTLAKECNVNYSNLSTALNDLGRWGYLISEPHPLNKRTRVLRVIYDDLPNGKGAVLPIGKASEGNEARSNDDAVKDGLPNDKNGVCPPDSQEVENVQQSQDKIFCETIKDSAKQEINSLKGLRVAQVVGLGASKQGPNDGGFLALVERQLKAGHALDPWTAERIEIIAQSYEYDEPIHQHATRLLETYEFSEPEPEPAPTDLAATYAALSKLEQIMRQRPLEGEDAESVTAWLDDLIGTTQRDTRNPVYVRATRLLVAIRGDA